MLEVGDEMLKLRVLAGDDVRERHHRVDAVAEDVLDDGRRKKLLVTLQKTHVAHDGLEQRLAVILI